jgi:protein kinase-like protein
VGTPAYMAPEQATNPDGVSIQSDFFSLGATLYHLATGESAFAAPQLGEVITKILYHVPPSPRSLAPDLSRGFDALIMRMLAKDPGDRPESVAALIENLERLPGDEGEADRPPRLISRPLLFSALGALLLVVVFAIAFPAGDRENGVSGDPPALASLSMAELLQRGDLEAQREGERRAELASRQIVSEIRALREAGDWEAWRQRVDLPLSEAGYWPRLEVDGALGARDERLVNIFERHLAEERRAGQEAYAPVLAAEREAAARRREESRALLAAGLEAAISPEEKLSLEERRARYEASLAKMISESSEPAGLRAQGEALIAARLERDAAAIEDLIAGRLREATRSLAQRRFARVDDLLAEMQLDPRFGLTGTRVRLDEIAESLREARGRIAERLALARADFVEKGLDWGPRSKEGSRFASRRSAPLDVALIRKRLQSEYEDLPSGGEDLGSDTRGRDQLLALLDLQRAMREIIAAEERLRANWRAREVGERFRGRDRFGRNFDAAEILEVKEEGLLLAQGAETILMRPEDLALETWAQQAALPAATAAEPHRRAAWVWLHLVAGQPEAALRLFDAARSDGVAPASLTWLRDAAERRWRDEEGVATPAALAHLRRLWRIDSLLEGVDSELATVSGLVKELLADPEEGGLGDGELARRHGAWLREVDSELADRRALTDRLSPWGETRIVDLAQGRFTMRIAPKGGAWARLLWPQGMQGVKGSIERRRPAETIVPGPSQQLSLPAALTLDLDRDWELSFEFENTGDAELAGRWLIFGVGEVYAGWLESLRRRASFANEAWHGLERGIERREEIGQAVLWRGKLEAYRSVFREALSSPAEGILEKEGNQRLRLRMSAKTRRLSLWKGSRRVVERVMESPLGSGVPHLSFPMPGVIRDLRVSGTLFDQDRESAPR